MWCWGNCLPDDGGVADVAGCVVDDAGGAAADGGAVVDVGGAADADGQTPRWDPTKTCL